eukprot:CAMPEP_0206136464 /NCGR_PEP_ID=MMETSP1473-20131121/1704_1 /ASSEMBLY_ACC=CAM_ASM_001109 /TAXON_ID=1461547 /ORGANISM="Stichococcus sp, Strain RCC1054" /LENGTH=75 /DNA_ID=CAMNT_0053529023 /DNA_START=409 /DNA_END=636 /DNA_ORIENTATION=-
MSQHCLVVSGPVAADNSASPKGSCAHVRAKDCNVCHAHTARAARGPAEYSADLHIGGGGHTQTCTLTAMHVPLLS